jgi:chromosome segregation ATPase
MAISGELVRGGAADLADVTNIMTATSMTELKRNIDQSIAKKKEENNMLAQMQQQIQQYEQTMKEMQNTVKQLQSENQKLSQEVERNSQAKLQLESQRIAIEREKVRNAKDYNDKVIETKQQEVQAQVAQIFDENPYNDKIKRVL